MTTPDGAPARRGRAAALVVACVLAAALGPAAPARAADPSKVLHITLPDINSLDPQQYNDSPSYDVLRAIYEGLYEYDYLASPARIVPCTAAALPVITDQGRTWTITLKRGIYFTPDPAFGGKRRELVAADYVYALQRWMDPTLRRGGDTWTIDLVVGARAVVDAAKRTGHFDYDAPIAGLRALDRYTLQLKLTDAVYPPIENALTTGALAREVVAAAGGDISTRPVGTGAYMLREWRRGSRVVLVANPDYRPLSFPQTDNPRWAAMARAMAGRTFPQIGEIDIAIMDEDQPRVLEFERGKLDYLRLYTDFATRLLDGKAVRPDLAARGITHIASAEPYTFAFYANMQDPTVGGMDAAHVALRRAIALGTNVDELIRVVFGGQAMVARQLVPPPAAGFDPALQAQPLYDPAAANALLDRLGYNQRDADGLRLAPGGKPLVLVWSLRSGGTSTTLATLIRKDMRTIGLRTDFHMTPFQDVIKELEGGKFALYYGGYGGLPSGYGILMQLDGRAPVAQNASRFASPRYDALMDQFMRTRDPQVQRASAAGMARIAETYVPLQPLVFRLENDFVQPWLEGFAPPAFDTYWKYLDLKADPGSARTPRGSAAERNK
ncbi:MAG: hypothetical protein JSR18_03330 [Proteobacteria bacterium]|nr:hypothetical protein [Pseudomonadota bacterium]